jgi:hypothetical protein
MSNAQNAYQKKVIEDAWMKMLPII